MTEEFDTPQQALRRLQGWLNYNEGSVKVISHNVAVWTTAERKTRAVASVIYISTPR